MTFKSSAPLNIWKMGPNLPFHLLSRGQHMTLHQSFLTPSSSQSISYFCTLTPTSISPP